MQKFEVEQPAELAAHADEYRWRIWVGGLPKNANEKSLAACFSLFGTLTECKIMTDNATGLSKGFAYVSFKDKDGFDKATGFKELKYLNTKLSIKVYQSKEETDRRSAEENERKIFLVNMHYKTKRSTVEEYFSKFGVIERVDLKTHNGIGFITFRDRLSAIRCFQCEETHCLDGRNIECRPVLSKGELKDHYMASRDKMNAKKLHALGLVDSQSNSDKRQRSENSSECETRPRNQVQLSTLLQNFQIPDQSKPTRSRYSEKSQESYQPKYETQSNRGSEGTRSVQNKQKSNNRKSEGKNLSTHSKNKPNEDLFGALEFLDDEDEDEEAVIQKKHQIDYTSTQASGLPVGVDRSTLKPPETKKKLSLSERFNSDRIARSYFDPSQIDSTFACEDGKKVKSDIVDSNKVLGLLVSAPHSDGVLPAIPEEHKMYESTFLELPK